VKNEERGLDCEQPWWYDEESRLPHPVFTRILFFFARASLQFRPEIYNNIKMTQQLSRSSV
jgi:hypothetical protein